MVNNHFGGYPSDIFQIGSRFPSISGTTVCLNGKELEKIRFEGIKKKVISYLKEHGSVKISDLAEKIDVSPRLVGRILRELEEEGMIKESE